MIISNFRESDFYVEDGSYLRMKHIQIGYTLPESLVQKLHISSCRIYVGGDDLITITNYSGIDPEVGLGDPIWTGVDGRAVLLTVSGPSTPDQNALPWVSRLNSNA